MEKVTRQPKWRQQKDWVGKAYSLCIDFGLLYPITYLLFFNATISCQSGRVVTATEWYWIITVHNIWYWKCINRWFYALNGSRLLGWNKAFWLIAAKLVVGEPVGRDHVCMHSNFPVTELTQVTVRLGADLFIWQWLTTPRSYSCTLYTL